MKPILNIGLLITLLLCFIRSAEVNAQSNLLKSIDNIEDETGYRFLYREALIRNLNVELNYSLETNQILNGLRQQLQKFSVGMKVDSLRKQVLLFRLTEEKQNRDIYISGYILDADSGERLPYATISWFEDEQVKGVSSDESGRFRIEISSARDEIILNFRYLGFKSEEVTIDLRDQQHWIDLAIRLKADALISNEIVINAINYYTPRDTVYSGLVRNGLFNPLGESNAIRALQMLPAVQTNTAINEGLNIRGSSPDGFLVQLDGVPIYNQSHLFGLLDSFNSEVLQTSGFYYDITPAQVTTPLGGTLSLITKTGSLNRFNVSTGISNTSYRATADGPIIKGKASFLVSGRISYMNELNWFNNSDLIEWGLDVGRPQSEVENEIDIAESGIRTGDYDASFYDLHAKINFENKDGSRILISAYSGADNIRQDYIRCINTSTRRPCLRSDPGRNNTLLDLDTRNEWGANAVSFQYQKAFNRNLFSQTSVGFSSYDLYYSKDDFTFASGEGNPLNFFLLPLIIENALNQIQFSQTFDARLNNVNITNGAEFIYYEVDYKENSLERLNLLDRNRSGQIDFFNQIDFTKHPFFNLYLGNRLHYFTDGSYMRWSPRYKIELNRDKPLSLSFGYSRNYQFLNKIQFSNANTADVWILANENEEPSSVNHYSTGIYAKVGKYSFFQVEGYIKQYQNLRLHELSTIYLNLSLQNESPFLSNTEGSGRGLELMYRTVFNKLDFTTTYTWSRMRLKNEFLNRGDSFDAAWDRRHQFNLALGYRIIPEIGINASYTFATGNPNGVLNFEERLAANNPEVSPVQRLADYSRFDLSLNFKSSKRSMPNLEANLFLFNVFNRNNVWYRDVVVALDSTQPVGNRLQTLPVDVYDLGFQPSFNLTLNF